MCIDGYYCNCNLMMRDVEGMERGGKVVLSAVGAPDTPDTWLTQCGSLAVTRLEGMTNILQQSGVEWG